MVYMGERMKLSIEISRELLYDLPVEYVGKVLTDGLMEGIIKSREQLRQYEMDILNGKPADKEPIGLIKLMSKDVQS